MQNVRVEFSNQELSLLRSLVMDAKCFSVDNRTDEVVELQNKLASAFFISDDPSLIRLLDNNDPIALCPASIPKRGGATSFEDIQWKFKRDYVQDRPFTTQIYRTVYMDGDLDGNKYMDCLSFSNHCDSIYGFSFFINDEYYDFDITVEQYNHLITLCEQSDTDYQAVFDFALSIVHQDKTPLCSYCNEPLNKSDVGQMMSRCHYSCAVQAGDIEEEFQPLTTPQLACLPKELQYFYETISLNGYDFVKFNTPKRTFDRKVSTLRKLGVSTSHLQNFQGVDNNA